jgi:hypothetical protein
MIDENEMLYNHECRINDLEKDNVKHETLIQGMADNIQGLRDDLNKFVERFIQMIYWVLGIFVTVGLGVIGFIIAIGGIK